MLAYFSATREASTVCNCIDKLLIKSSDLIDKVDHPSHGPDDSFLDAWGLNWNNCAGNRKRVKAICPSLLQRI